MKKHLNFSFSRALLSVLVVISILISSFSTLCLSVGAATTDKLTTICSLNLRSSASTSASVLTTLPSGASVTLLSDSTNGWAYVSYSTYKGYCSTAYLNLPSGSTATMSGKTTDAVNLRSGKGTSYSSLAVIPNSTTVTVTDNSDEDWAKVTYSSKSGYVKKDYLTVMFALSADEAVTPSYSYPSPSYSSLPHWYSYSYTDSVLGNYYNSFSKLVLNKSSLKLDPYDIYKLAPLMSGDKPVSEHTSYISSNPSVASVTDSGVVSAVSSGTATITVTDLVSMCSVECAVTVTGSVVAPTQAPTQKPTQAPTQAPTQKPTQAPTVAPTEADDLSISATKATIYTGNHYQIIAKSSKSVTWTTSNSSVATVSDGIVVAKSAGTATITAKTSTQSLSCKITVKAPTTSVYLSHDTATVTAGKTFLAYSSTSSVTWSSSNEEVATVKGGYILGVSAGTAVIKVAKSGGASTMLVTVTEPAPVRFAYTSPNCAPKNSDITLIAITDKKRTAVKFNVKVGSTTQSVTASSKTSDGDNYIWKGKINLSSAGTYNVTAYSKYNGSWSTCSDGSTTAFVTSTTDKTTTVCANRRASDEIIDLIACYEGFISSIYADPLTGDPTVGYGRVIYSGQQFYNELTKTEAYAYLVQTVNNDGYATKVNNFLVNNGVKFNQQQFDALVCFVYNTGTGVLTNDDELVSALLNCNSGSSGTKEYYINGSAVRIRKCPGTDYDIIKELDYGTTFTILEKTNSSWYYVKLADGTKGYVCTDYISSRTSSGDLDLNFVNQQNLINKFCQYHHANGCVYGLLYRRVDEMEVFIYNDYDRNYGVYNYNIKFTCASNSSFHT